MSSVFVVDQRQSAVVFALGEIKRVVSEPGLHFKLPPPFQNVQYFDKRTLTLDDADIDRFITSEKLNIQIDSFVKWRIVDPRLFFVSVGGSELLAVDRIIAQPARRAEQRDRPRMTVAEVIYRRARWSSESVRAQVSNEDSLKIGVGDRRRPPEAGRLRTRGRRAGLRRMQSERKQVANERRATGTAESEKIRADADRQREVLLAKAYRDAQNASRARAMRRRAGIYAEAFGRRSRVRRASTAASRPTAHRSTAAVT